jgi:uncharacterized coiled-coil protein SlyX
MTEEQAIFVDESEGVSEAGDSAIIRVFRFLFRFTIVVIFGALLGIAVYLGVPAFYREFVEPVRVNTHQIDTLNKELNTLNEDIGSQGTTVDEIEAMLEGTIAAQRETIAELSAQVGALEISIEELKDSAEGIADLDRRLDEVDSVIGDLNSSVGAFGLRIQDANTPVAKFSRQLQLIKAMELLTRARFWFVQDNLGKATEDIQTAKDVVEGVLRSSFENEASSEDEVELLSNIVERLDQALLAIEITPVVAADDLEIVWQLLILATAP